MECDNDLIAALDNSYRAIAAFDSLVAKIAWLERVNFDIQIELSQRERANEIL